MRVWVKSGCMVRLTVHPNVLSGGNLNHKVWYGVLLWCWKARVWLRLVWYNVVWHGFSWYSFEWVWLRCVLFAGSLNHKVWHHASQTPLCIFDARDDDDDDAGEFAFYEEASSSTTFFVTKLGGNWKCGDVLRFFYLLKVWPELSNPIFFKVWWAGCELATVGDGGEDRTQMPRTSSLQVETVVINVNQCLCSLLNDHLNIIIYILKPFSCFK